MGGRTNFRQISESDFLSLLQALSATTKGRSFLAEYRRRSRPDDTCELIDSLARIERSMASVRDQLCPERLADELRRVAMTLEIATDGVEADAEGDEMARRMALIGRAKAELAVMAAGLGRGEENGGLAAAAQDSDPALSHRPYGEDPGGER